MDYDFAHATASPPAMVAQQMPMVGGFKPVALNTPEAKAAFATALNLVKTVSELEELDLTKPELLSVMTQVVAGRNYRVEFRIGQPQERHVLQVQYYQPLKGNVQLKQVNFDGAPIMGDG